MSTHRWISRSSSTGNPGAHLPLQNTADLPAAVRKLQTQPGFHYKVSSCKKVAISKSSVEKKDVTKKKNNTSGHERTEKMDCTASNDCFRFLGETEGIRQLVIAEAAVCANCKKGKLLVSFESVGIATDIHTKCSHCKQWSSSGYESTEMSSGPKSIARNTHQSANILFVLAMLLSGDGGTEARHITGLLDMPTSASIDRTNFPSIKYDLATRIIDFTKELLEKNMMEEVKLWSKDNPSFNIAEWREAWENNRPLAFHLMPTLVVSYDMGWQKRSSGNRYDSHSGHAAAVGCKTRKPIALAVLSKFCCICSSGADDVPDHDCLKNFEGASGAMEPHALVDLLVAHEQMDKYYVLFGTIVADDDSTMRAQMKWSNANWMIDTGSRIPPKIIGKDGRLSTRPDKGRLKYPPRAIIPW
jgi:hypothetical protein